MGASSTWWASSQAVGPQRYGLAQGNPSIAAGQAVELYLGLAARLFMRRQYLAQGLGFARDRDEITDRKPQGAHVIRVQTGHHPAHIPSEGLGDLET